jgi:hypothetical protein
MSETLKTLVDSRAEGLGLSFGAIVEDILLEAHGLSRDPRTALMMEIGHWLHHRCPSGNFPANIILEAFEHIADDDALLGLYRQATKDSNPTEEQKNAAHLNRHIGRSIKHILGAKTGERVRSKKELKNALVDSFVKLLPG